MLTWHRKVVYSYIIYLCNILPESKKNWLYFSLIITFFQVQLRITKLIFQTSFIGDSRNILLQNPWFKMIIFKSDFNFISALVILYYIQFHSKIISTLKLNSIFPLRFQLCFSRITQWNSKTYAQDLPNLVYWKPLLILM